MHWQIAVEAAVPLIQAAPCCRPGMMWIERQKHQFLAAPREHILHCLGRKRVPVSHCNETSDVQTRVAQPCFKDGCLLFGKAPDWRPAPYHRIVVLNLFRTGG